MFDNSNQLFGADKITAIMNEQGHKVCNKTVLELMREMGLYSISTNAKKEYLKWKRGENRKVH
ncbi:transposase [Christensenella tenuis]|uniref:transposase n=1 Tax=Christensenella tenuis TaxID=2763033 RepID=UPI0038B3300D